MGDVKYSLMWDAYNKNICNGLSSLQQHGEFVDMTLAADGHHVKVHKMVMSLISPYIKDLISSADCPHPVIFLNQISYETLTSILEYVYTGQVLVAKDNLIKFMEACKALHIKGFDEMNTMHNEDIGIKCEVRKNTELLSKEQGNTYDCNNSVDGDELGQDIETDITADYLNVDQDEHDPVREVITKVKDQGKSPNIQYSLSNQGHLQLVLNRYVYNLRYSRKSGQHSWQCVDGHWRSKKCPARVVTYRDTVVARSKIHNHPHHDRKILKKVEAGTIFTALRDAEVKMNLRRIEKEVAQDK